MCPPWKVDSDPAPSFLRLCFLRPGADRLAPTGPSAMMSPHRRPRAPEPAARGLKPRAPANLAPLSSVPWVSVTATEGWLTPGDHSALTYGAAARAAKAGLPGRRGTSSSEGLFLTSPLSRLSEDQGPSRRQGSPGSWACGTGIPRPDYLSS